ncbi:MAG: hypothetical protein MHM6MM_000697 [Cercozoa sp. M6MM]
MGIETTPGCGEPSCESVRERMLAGMKKMRDTMSGGVAATSDRPAFISMEDFERLENMPPDREMLGRAGWTTLHSMAAYYPESASPEQQQRTLEFLRSFAQLYPCRHCGEHMLAHIDRHVPDTSGRDALSLWLCRAHNEVNKMLGKPVFDCSTVLQRWRGLDVRLEDKDFEPL